MSTSGAEDMGSDAGDAVRRSSRKRVVKRYGSPSPPPSPAVKKPRESTDDVVADTPTVSKPKPAAASTNNPNVSSNPSATKTYAAKTYVVKTPGASPAAAGPSTSKPAAKPAIGGAKQNIGGASTVKPIVGSAKRPVGAAKPTAGASAAKPKAPPPPSVPNVKSTRVWLTKSNALRIEDDPRIDLDVRKRITELRAANDALANSNTAYSRQILRVGDKLSRLRKKLEDGAQRDSAEALITKAKEMLTPVPGMLFACQLRNCGRAPGTRRFTEADLLLANAIYNQSARCYLFLSKVFALPGIEGLLQWISKVEPEPGKGLTKEFYESRNMAFLLDPVPFQGVPVNTGKKKTPKKKKGVSDKTTEDVQAGESPEAVNDVGENGENDAPEALEAGEAAFGAGPEVSVEEEVSAETSNEDGAKETPSTPVFVV